MRSLLLSTTWLKTLTASLRRRIAVYRNVLFPVLAACLLCSCSYFQSASESLEDPTIGATVAGGVVGAGVGGMIGNQTGSTMGGVAIGTIAGAGAGALAGSYVEELRNHGSEQQKILDQNDQKLADQRRELASLRGLSRDGVSYRNDSVDDPRASYNSGLIRVPATNLIIPEKLRGSRPNRAAQVTPAAAPVPSYRQAQPAHYLPPQPAPIARPVKERTVAPEKPLTTVRAEAGFGNSQAPSTSASSTHTSQNAIRVAANTPAPSKPAFVVVDAAATKASAVAAARTEPTSVASLPPHASTESSNSQDAETLGEQRELTSDETSDCKDGMTEYEKGTAAKESADKLFHFRRALRLCPSTAVVHNALGELYITLGRVEDAQFQFRQALRLDPNLKVAQNNLSGLMEVERY